MVLFIGAAQVFASLPEDMGPARINVSGYPAEYQETYREIFLKVCGFFGGAPRLLNSPLIEMDSQTEASERRSHPGLFGDDLILKPSRDGWKKWVEAALRRPPCCGSCPVLSFQEGRRLWRFLAYDSLVRKTGQNAEAWIHHRKALIEKFKSTGKWLRPQSLAEWLSSNHYTEQPFLGKQSKEVVP